MHTAPKRILIIDDDGALTDLLTDYLNMEGFSATSANNGPDGLKRLEDETFDLVVLDVMMPGMSGVEVLKVIRAKGQLPVLMLTAKGDPIDRIVGLELGADDYVPKPCPPRELLARINAILRRTAQSESSVAPITVGDLVVKPSSRTAMGLGKPIELTSTEFSLLELLARQAGKPVPKDEIYVKVLGRQMGPYDRAIDVHVSAVRHKIAAVLGKTVLIESIRGVGYQLVHRPEEPA